MKKTTLYLLMLISCSTSVWAQSKTDEPLFTVHHFTISVNNLDTMKAWYINVLGCTLVKHDEDSSARSVRLALNGFLIDMLQVNGAFRQPSQDMAADQHLKAEGYRHFVLIATDITRAYTTLQARGVVFYRDAKDKNSTSIPHHSYFKDPEGNIIGLIGPSK